MPWETRAPKIAYLIKCFPRVSETFILHEVLELEQQGLQLRIFSLRTPAGGKVSQAVQQVQAPVTYQPPLTVRGMLERMPAAGRRLLSHPRRFLRAIACAVASEGLIVGLRDLLDAADLSQRLEGEGITHLHAHYANTPATVARIVSQLTGIPFSFTAHAKDIYLTPPRRLRQAMQAARFVVTCTAYNQRYLTGVGGEEIATSIHRIYHGLNLCACALPAHAAADRRPGRPLVLAVARLVEKKGLADLLRACRLLLDRGYDFDCRIVGDGVLRATLEEQVRDLELTDHVHLWGSEAHERVLAMYREATVFALPCVIGENGDRDGIPNALVEAMYLGTPVVTTPVSGIPELIVPEVNGLLCPQHAPEALAAAIARLLDDPFLRERLVSAGRQTVEERFDMARNVTQLKALLLGIEPSLGRDLGSGEPTDNRAAVPDELLAVGAR